MWPGYCGYILNVNNNTIAILSTEHNDPQEISFGIHLENKSSVHLSNTLLEIPVLGNILGELYSSKDKYFLSSLSKCVSLQHSSQSKWSRHNITPPNLVFK